MSNPKTQPATEAAQFAELCIEKIQEQTKVLLAKHWPEIKKLIDEDEEISIGMKVSIIDRTPTPGEHSDVDSRIKTTMSFAKKVSDSTESPLPDVNQPEIPGIAVVK